VEVQSPSSPLNAIFLKAGSGMALPFLLSTFQPEILECDAANALKISRCYLHRMQDLLLLLFRNSLVALLFDSFLGIGIYNQISLLQILP
jgi:hypothetical protein